MMLKTMNTSMASSGGSVELKKKLPNGTLITSSEADKKGADLQAMMRQSAECILSFGRDEKVEWAKERRIAANGIFEEGKFQEAMDMYMTCFVAIAGTDKSLIEVNESEEHIQLPVLLNLAACAINLGQASKAIQFCDNAIDLSSGVGRKCVKIWRRRGKAKLKKGDYGGAREDFREALALCEGEEDEGEEAGFIRKDLRKLQGHLVVAKKQTEKVKQVMKRALSSKSTDANGVSLYKDKGKVEYSQFSRGRDHDKDKLEVERKEVEEVGYVRMIIKAFIDCFVSIVEGELDDGEKFD